MFGKVAGSTLEPEDPVILENSSQDRICGYIEVRRQFDSLKPSLFGGSNTGVSAVGGRQPGLKDDSESLRGGPQKGNRRDLPGSFGKGHDHTRSDSMDDAASVISTATSTASISTKATNGSTTSLLASAPKTGAFWAAARNAMPALSRPVPVKERFYCVLKEATIYVYDDQVQREPVHVIPVDRYQIKIHTSEGEFQGREGQMFNKKNAIVLQSPNQGEFDDGLPGVPMSRKDTPTSKKDWGDTDHEPWYLFVRNHSEYVTPVLAYTCNDDADGLRMEDWYLALLRQSHENLTHDKTFSPLDMQYLVNSIINEQDPIASRWINSLLGILFLRMCETAFAEEVCFLLGSCGLLARTLVLILQFIIGRIMRKLRKIPKSSFFKDIAVREVNLGTVPPS